MPAPWRASICWPMRSRPRSRPGMALGPVGIEVKPPMVAFGEHGDAVDVGVPERTGEGVGVETDAYVRDIGAGVKIEVDGPAGELLPAQAFG